MMRSRLRLLALCMALYAGIACQGSVAFAQAENANAVTAHKQSQQKPVRKAKQPNMSGLASYYAKRFHGSKTSSGRHYDMHALTAAHRSLPFGTWVKVTNKRNGRSVVVEIIDRGPFARNHVIDLSWAAATKLGMRKNGVAPVKLTVVSPPKQAKSARKKPAVSRP